MPDQFTDQFPETTIGYGNYIVNLTIWSIISLIIFAASFWLLYWNEGRIDLSKIAKTAVEISATSINTDSSLNGRLISATGIFNSNEVIGDNLFLKPDRFIAVERKVEMYSWIEHSESHSTGSTTYTYTKNWEENPQSPSSFRHPEGHENPQKTLASITNKVQNATLGAYQVEMSSVTLPEFAELQINKQNITLSQGAILANDSYLFISKNPGSTFDDLQIGDLRVSYSVLYPGNTATIFGKLDRSSISPYFYKTNRQLYRIFWGTRDEAIATLHSEYIVWLWILRLVGFLGIWIGLLLLFSPISNFLPILGALSSLLIGIATFLISLVLTMVTIIVSMIIHNLIVLLIALVATAVVIVLGIMKITKQKLSSQSTPPPATGSISK